MVWVVFLVRWVDFLVGSSKSLGFFGGYIFLARDWNLHVINSHVAGAIGWSFMKLDAVWHEWILAALAVVIDGVLAVSAQCGCCHHFLPYFSHMPYQVCFLWLPFFSIGLHPVCCMYYGFLPSILHIILHGFPFVFCFLFLFLLLHGVYIVGIMGFVWWGVLFCCICTTTSLSIPCSPYNVYSSIFSVMFCMLISSFTYPPIFAFSPFVCVLSMLG